MELSGAGDDVLRLLGGVRMPAEVTARLDLVNNRGRRCRTAAAIARECALPTDRRIALPPDLRAFEFAGIDDRIHGLRPLLVDGGATLSSNPPGSNLQFQL